MFARVYTVESKINKLLGEAYPFEAPTILLPSAEKRKKSKSKAAKPAKKVSIKIRRLNSEEVGYRITWIDKNNRKTTDVRNTRNIMPLLQSMLPGTKLEKVEIMSVNGVTETIAL